MVFKLARALADRAGLAMEWTQDKAQRYFVYLAKTLIRFAIGCTVAGLLAWYTFTYRSLVTAVLTVVVLLVSYGLLYVVATPVAFGLAWASGRWEAVKRIYHGFSDMILSTVLTIFYVVGDRLYELPEAFLGFVGVFVVFLTIAMLPKTTGVNFVYGRIKYPIIAMVVGVTIWQHGLTANWRDEALLWRNDSPLEVSAQLSPSNTIVDEKGNPLQFEAKSREGKPIPHHGRYFDENGTIHVVRMHPEETELKYQGYTVKSFTVPEISQFRKQLRDIIDKQKKTADDAARKVQDDAKAQADQAADQAKAEVAKQEAQRKTDEARLKVQQEEQPRLEAQQREVQQQEDLRRAQQVATAERERQEAEARRTERLQEVSKNIARMKAGDEINKSPTTWPPQGFTANGVRRFETREELILVDALVINAEQMPGEKDLVYAALNHPVQYGTLLYPSGNPRGTSPWTVTKFALGSLSDVKDKEGNPNKNVYSLELKPKELEVFHGLRAIIRPPVNLPRQDIFLASDPILLLVKKGGYSWSDFWKEAGMVGGGLGLGAAIGGATGAAIGAGAGAVGGVAISKATQPAYSFKHSGKNFELPADIRLAFFIRR